MIAAIERWLVDALGRRVERVQGEFYVGRQLAFDEFPLSIWIQFTGATLARLFGKPDGWGMGLDQSPPTGSNMGPAGRTVIKDMAKMRPFSQCMGYALKAVAVCSSPGSADPIGVRLNFESGGVIYILNWGDELVVDNQLPNDASPDDVVVCALGRKDDAG